MFFLSGDLHEEPKARLSLENFPEMQCLTKNDYIIFLGDFGCVWNFRGEVKKEKLMLDWLEGLPCSVLFIDGNHENFDRLNAYPAVSWNGGMVHEIRPHVLHLMRGYVFNIDGKKFFTFGGGKSCHIRDGILDPILDYGKIMDWMKDSSKHFRINHITWWEEEMPSHEEMERGIESLTANDYKVDYILTHSPASGIAGKIPGSTYDNNPLMEYLETEVRKKVSYKRWFAAHMHMDISFDNKDFILFRQILRIS